jgi:hypothetical protein
MSVAARVTKKALKQIEAAAVRGAERNAEALARFAKGGLERAAEDLLGTGRPHIAIVTGFVAAAASPIVAENDGPVGAALLARLFRAVGWGVSGLTDSVCAAQVDAAFAAAGLAPNDRLTAIVGSDGRTATPIAEVEAWLKARSVTHLLAIERSGRAASGRCYNMSATDITAYVYDFDRLFTPGTWTTIGVGDGGNEIGMGAIPAKQIAKQIRHGETVACATPADSLIVCGVSNWGAYALGGALAVLDERFRAPFFATMDRAGEREIFDALASAGAVDGVTGRPDRSVDGIPLALHDEKRDEIRRIVENAVARIG